MSERDRIRFGIARQEWETALIHALNHDTFAVEIPQHARRPDSRLVDRFHEQNTYVVGTRGRELVGMIAIRDQRPFSLDEKLPDLDHYLPPSRHPCEIRLLAVARGHRRGRVLQGLFATLARHAAAKGYDLALISGRVAHLKLYRNLGFLPFGPEVGASEARYQPMYLSRSAFGERKRRLRTLRDRSGEPTGVAEGEAPIVPAGDEPIGVVNLLPGPVTPLPAVLAALSGPPVSHRSRRFAADAAHLRRRLCALTRAANAQLLLGSGTLGNDVVAQQIGRMAGSGLILSNGEFGDRLLAHGRAAGLRFEAVRARPGRAFDPDGLRRRLDALPDAAWLWACHCETSTGVLNDLPALAAVCRERGLALCLDAVSSIGCVPVDLREVFLASATSGKGLGAPAGVAVVFHREPVAPSPDRIPPYLDLGVYAASDGVPFTHSSQLVAALAAALDGVDWPARFAALRADAAALRRALRRRGLKPLARSADATPAVITLAPPPGVRSSDVGEDLERGGVLVHYRSRYLVAANRFQVSLMGHDRPPPEWLAARIADAVARAGEEEARTGAAS